MNKVIKSILIIISYFIYDLLFKAILYAFNINFYTLNTNHKVIVTIIINVIYMLLLIFIYRKELLEELKDFKRNYKKYLSNNILIYLLGIAIMFIINLILNRITNKTLSGNEEIVRLLIKEFPIYMFFSTVIYAPLVEELIFRKTVRKIFKNKNLFIIACGLVFGALHISNYSDINEILYSIPYIIMGMDFAYIYYKTDNIFTTITFHLCHNLILLIIQLI